MGSKPLTKNRHDSPAAVAKIRGASCHVDHGLCPNDNARLVTLRDEPAKLCPVCGFRLCILPRLVIDPRAAFHRHFSPTINPYRKRYV